jgi:hypothetical protein
MRSTPQTPPRDAAAAHVDACTQSDRVLLLIDL